MITLEKLEENEKLKEHLNTSDRFVYEMQVATCKECLKSKDKLCQDKYVPYIVYDEFGGNYELTYTRCPKSRGWHKSYISLDSFENIFETPKREFVLQKFLNGKGGYIYGNAGRGKTYIMGYTANELNKQGKSIWFELANNITQKVWNFETRDETLELATTVDVLFIDDFGGEMFTERVIFDVWSPIIKGRIDNNKPIYISSNYDPGELSKKIVKASDNVTATVLLDRIIAQGVIHELDDKNYRLEVK